MPLFRRVQPPFSLKTLQKDPNCIAIQDPSAVWGVQDFLARRNLLLSTDTLATQNVTVVATAYKLYCQGTGSITLSGTATGTLQGTGANGRVVLSFTPTAGTLTLTVSGTVTYGMLCRADTIDQSYQRITDWVTEQYAWAAQNPRAWLRRNRFLNTATLSTQTVSSVTANPITVSFKGTGTITFSTAYSGSLVGTGASDRVSVTFTPSAGNLVCTVTGSVTLAQCEVGSTATAYQEVGTSWAATYTALAQAAGYPISMFSDRAGTTAVDAPDTVVGVMKNLKGDYYHATAPSDVARPVLTLDGNGAWYLYRDGADDNLPVTWATNLTSTGVIYVAAGDYTTKDSGLTLSGATNYTTPKADYGRIVMASESKYDAKIIKYLDGKRGRTYSLGPELVTNGGFDSASGWNPQTGWSISGGVAIRDGSSGANSVYQINVVTAGKTYLCTYTIKSVTAGSFRMYCGSSSIGPYNSLPGVYSEVRVAAGNGYIYIEGASLSAGQIDNVSVREVLIQ